MSCSLNLPIFSSISRDGRTPASLSLFAFTSTANLIECLSLYSWGTLPVRRAPAFDFDRRRKKNERASPRRFGVEGGGVDEKRFRFDLLVALVALAISGVAAGSSAYQTYVIRKQFSA